VVAQKTAGMSLVAVETGAPPGKAVSVATREMIRASPAAMDAGLLIMKISRRGETPVAAQKAVEAPPMAVEAGARIMEISRRGKPLWPPTEAVRAPPTVVEAGAPPGRACEKVTARVVYGCVYSEVTFLFFFLCINFPYHIAL
jgi:hypothetical protein